MDKIITISRSEYEDLKREISELRKLVQQLRAENSLLKGGKGSRTGSTAPSHDIRRSNKISLRFSTGATLAMSDSTDEIIDHHPLLCGQCGEDLHTVESRSFTPRQEFDIPSVSPICIEHRSHLKICPLCSCHNRGLFPNRLQAPVQYGAHVEAMTGYLSVYQSLPCRRIKHLFRDFFRLNLSEGVLDIFLERLSLKSALDYKDIGERIHQKRTGCLCGFSVPG